LSFILLAFWKEKLDYAWGRYLRQFFLLDFIREGGILHHPASQVAKFKSELVKEQFRKAHIANDIKSKKNCTCTLPYVDGHYERVSVICYLLNIRNAESSRECKKTI
jgi:hypothetical protein